MVCSCFSEYIPFKPSSSGSILQVVGVVCACDLAGIVKSNAKKDRINKEEIIDRLRFMLVP